MHAWFAPVCMRVRAPLVSSLRAAIWQYCRLQTKNFSLNVALSNSQRMIIIVHIYNIKYIFTLHGKHVFFRFMSCHLWIICCFISSSHRFNQIKLYALICALHYECIAWMNANMMRQPVQGLFVLSIAISHHLIHVWNSISLSAGFLFYRIIRKGNENEKEKNRE